MIHYFVEGMVWVCKTAAENESGRSLIGVNFWKRSTTWTDIVEEHSGRKLTYQADKLISISGIASEMQKSRQGDRYFDGLWEKDLPRCLLWKPLFLYVAERNNKLSHVPSWSWASRICVVIFNISKGQVGQGRPTSNLNDFCEIEKIEGRALGDTGPGRKPRLFIKCLLKSLKDVYIHAAWPEQSDDDGLLGPYNPKRVEEETLFTRLGEEIGWVIFDDGIHCHDPDRQGAVYFLPVVRDAGEGLGWSEGLLVQKSASTENEFERVGVAQIKDVKWLKGLLWQTVCLY